MSRVDSTPSGLPAETAQEREDRALWERHLAALDALRKGASEGDILLSYVLWPTARIDEAVGQVAVTGGARRRPRRARSSPRARVTG